MCCSLAAIHINKVINFPTHTPIVFQRLTAIYDAQCRIILSHDFTYLQNPKDFLHVLVAIHFFEQCGGISFKVLEIGTMCGFKGDVWIYLGVSSVSSGGVGDFICPARDKKVDC